MKKFNKVIVAVLTVSFVLGLTGPITALAAGPLPVNLGTAGNFVILSKTGITTTGATSITGDIGVSPIGYAAMTGFSLVPAVPDGSNTFSTSALVTGKVYASDYTAPTPAMLTTAVSDMLAAYTDASGRLGPDGTDLYGGNIGGQIFTPGLYKWTTGVTIPTDVTLSGGPNDVWIFQVAGTLDISANMKVLLSGGALASNVFWAVAGTTTLEPGSTFEGIILAGPGTSTIAGQSGATLHGRALGQKDVTLIANTIVAPVLVAPASTAGGGVYISRIVPLIGILKVPTPLALPAGPGSVTYNYTVWNVQGQRAMVNVAVTDDKCRPVTYLSGDLNGNNKLDPGENWKYSCTTTVSGTTTNTSIATGYSDDPYHLVAIATALATVVVSAPLPPPLINIVKVPSRLTPFPFGGGNVVYRYTVTNPGVVAMNNVAVSDDKCSPVSYTSGDANGNNLLDPGEAWVYTCQANIPVSTRNVATVKGSANGFTATGYAFANVLVSAPVLSVPTPGLPNTGFPPEERSTPWNIIALTGILMLVSASIVVALRKRANQH